MRADGSIWTVMIRDVTDRGIMVGTRGVFVCLVLDLNAGNAAGAQVAATVGKACRDALAQALTDPEAGPAGPGAPGEIQCDLGYAAEVEKALAKVFPGQRPPVVERVPPDAAEEVLESLLGALSGRDQSPDAPEPTDWVELVEATWAFRDAEPWQRRSDVDTLRVVTRTEDGTNEYTASVIGREGVQRGLNLFPGKGIPRLGDWRPGDPFPMPDGTYIVYLDDLHDATPEHAGKALRYGWPEDADLWPSWFVVRDGAPADLDATDARRLVEALHGIARH
jgi:hypothetical protein